MTEIYEELELNSDTFAGQIRDFEKVIFTREFQTRQQVENFKTSRTNTRIKRRHEHNHGRVNRPCKVELFR